MRLGIDFGTTRTVVAVCDHGNTPVVGFEGPDGTTHDHIPTLVARRGDELRYGWHAAAVLGDEGWHGLRSFKRLLSGAEARPGRTVELGDREVSLHELITGFLVHVREQLQTASNAPGIDEGPHECFVAVPAGASSQQRFATLAAFRAAGFSVVGMLNEPSAAGIEYAHRYGKTLTSARQEVLVYDLGGGTFDASRVSMAEGRHEVVRHVGLTDFGGSDFDEVLLDLALASAGCPRPKDDTALLEHVREQKEGLTPNSRKVLVELDDDTVVTLQTSHLYAACSPLVERSVAVLGELLDDEAEAQLAGVYVVGGASELPVVARTLRERFGRRVKRSAYASASIAVGLALALDGQAPQVDEQLSRSFGVFREWAGGDDVVFDAILTPEHRRGSEPRVRRYRAVHNVGWLRFVECDHVADGVPDGDVTPYAELRFPYDPALEGADLASVPVRRLGEGPVIEERYDVDELGMVHVTITNLESGFALQHALG
jgi:molecular chaperone DnaK (HSP70)